MSKREFTRTLVVVVLSLGLGLAPVVAQAAPNLAGEERGGSIWDVFAPVVRLWEAIWERDESGPSVDPTSVVRKLYGAPHATPIAGRENASLSESEVARARVMLKTSR